MLVGAESLKRLEGSKVAVFGIGGVGSFAVEALARSAVGRFLLVDGDVVTESNINRQIHSMSSTLGRPKAEVMKERIADINPNAVVLTVNEYYPCDIEWDFDYVIDAVDTVSAKIDIVINAKHKGIPVISSMGAGNKLHPEMFRIADIFETRVCPLARVMRRELRARGVKDLKVVYSEESPVAPVDSCDSVDPFNPADSCDSVAPVDSCDSVAPVAPVDSCDFVAPVDSCDFVAPVAPVDSCDSVGPFNPADSCDSVAPVAPVDSCDFVAPVDSCDFVAPVDSCDSVGPFNPVDSCDSVGPVNSDYAHDVAKADIGRIKRVPGSIAFVPSVAGLIIAGEVVRDLMG
ncbi:MAG: tRNA threonylcarbamoyladenosine dehydratase [Oscillospiraceae bacterium]|nr:tRNA threonylcarbamoyladenosine dehydratase [Oscillospiraceae bacterium]